MPRALRCYAHVPQPGDQMFCAVGASSTFTRLCILRCSVQSAASPRPQHGRRRAAACVFWQILMVACSPFWWR
jgi:hypothetical protein